MEMAPGALKRTKDVLTAKPLVSRFLRLHTNHPFFFFSISSNRFAKATLLDRCERPLSITHIDDMCPLLSLSRPPFSLFATV